MVLHFDRFHYHIPAQEDAFVARQGITAAQVHNLVWLSRADAAHSAALAKWQWAHPGKTPTAKDEAEISDRAHDSIQRARELDPPDIFVSFTELHYNPPSE